MLEKAIPVSTSKDNGVITLPFYETFDTEESLTKWTIIDKNGGVTWRYFEGTAAYLLDPDQQANELPYFAGY